MSAAHSELVAPDAGPLAPSPTTRAERLARGILLVQQGLTVREAGARCGTHYSTLWRALQRLDAEWEQRDEKAWQRATSKAEVVAEMVLQRMLEGVDTCPPSVLPAWGMFAARVAGWENVKERADSGESMLGAILDRLGNGGSVRVGVEVTAGSDGKVSNLPAQSPNVPKASAAGVIKAQASPIEDGLAHTHTHAEGAGEKAR